MLAKANRLVDRGPWFVQSITDGSRKGARHEHPYGAYKVLLRNTAGREETLEVRGGAHRLVFEESERDHKQAISFSLTHLFYFGERMSREAFLSKRSRWLRAIDIVLPVPTGTPKTTTDVSRK
jgi:hypothetical protein